jgi:hypothetical protein
MAVCKGNKLVVTKIVGATYFWAAAEIGINLSIFESDTAP